MQRAHRLKRELAQLAEGGIDGVCCYPKNDNLDLLTATVLGPAGSPYAGGVFHLDVEVPERYPFVPPRIVFRTSVYHPNVDEAGRICMDLLKMPPKGAWKPTIGLKSLLDAVRCLLGNPNPDDPLVAEIAEEYRFNRQEFERKARKCAASSCRS